MRRTAILAAILIALLASSCGTSSKPASETTRGAENTSTSENAGATEDAWISEEGNAVMFLQRAVPLLEAYFQDHNTYSGATSDKLRAYDPSIWSYSIARARKDSYCLEASAGDTHVFKNGPAAEIMLGSCDDPNGERPFNPPSESPPLETTFMRASVAAIEAYAEEHNGYTGMTLPELREFDYGVPDLKIVTATKKTYCVEISANGESSYMRGGPSIKMAKGTCPK